MQRISRPDEEKAAAAAAPIPAGKNEASKSLVSRPTPDLDRLSAVSASLLLALAAARLIEAPLRHYELGILGSPLGLTVTTSTVINLLVVGLAAAGMHWLLSKDGAAGRWLRSEAPFWLLPALTGIGLLAWLESLDQLGAWMLAMLVAAVLVPLALALELAAAGAPDAASGHTEARWQGWARPFLIHLLALLFAYALLVARLRLLAGGPLLFAFITLLAARHFWEPPEAIRPALVYGAVTGLLLVQLYWLLNHLALSDLRAAALLLLAFYLIVGLMPQLAGGGWRPRLAGEYAVVGLLVAALIFLFVP